jgi:hypothetical protein
MTHRPPKPEHLEAHCEQDVVVARIRGPYDTAVAHYLESIYIDQVNRFGYRLALLYAHETTTITPEARRLMSEWNATRKDPSAGAVIGASFAAKTVANLMSRAVALITRAPAPLNFFDTEAEARYWIDAQRPWLKQASRAKK